MQHSEHTHTHTYTHTKHTHTCLTWFNFISKSSKEDMITLQGARKERRGEERDQISAKKTTGTLLGLLKPECLLAGWNFMEVDTNLPK